MYKKITLLLLSLSMISYPIHSMEAPPALGNNNVTENKDVSTNDTNSLAINKWWIAGSALVFIYGIAFGRAIAQQMKLKKTTFIGIIRITGPITTADEYMTQIRAFNANPLIKGILVEINSPGGGAAVSEQIFAELKKCAENKSVVVMIEGIACSGAYLIASAGHKIVAQAMSSVGNIGTFIDLYHFTEAPKHYIFDPSTFSVTHGTIEYEEMAAGKFKRAGSITRPITDQERESFKQQLADIYNHFCSLVSAQRNISLETQQDWAEGRILTGNQALKLGLVDKIGSRTDALEVLVELMKNKYGAANVFNQNIVFMIPGTNSFWKRMSGAAAYAMARALVESEVAYR